MGSYAGVDYNLTPYVHSRLQHIYHRATLCQSRLYPPVRDFGFGLWGVWGLFRQKYGKALV
jgi:hypothetical protein